jgi:hypothetical protein
LLEVAVGVAASTVVLVSVLVAALVDTEQEPVYR